MNMDDLRGQLRIDAAGSVNISFKINEYDPNDDVSPVFECVTCDSVLVWSTGFNRYECPECSIELTSQEAVDLCDRYKKLLDILSSKSGKKDSFWRRIFR